MLAEQLAWLPSLEQSPEDALQGVQGGGHLSASSFSRKFQDRSELSAQVVVSPSQPRSVSAFSLFGCREVWVGERALCGSWSPGEGIWISLFPSGHKALNLWAGRILAVFGAFSVRQDPFSEPFTALPNSTFSRVQTKRGVSPGKQTGRVSSEGHWMRVFGCETHVRAWLSCSRVLPTRRGAVFSKMGSATERVSFSETLAREDF